MTPQERAQRLARYYDLDLVDIAYDAELYQQLAHEVGGPIFELAVGSGRLAIPLALAGYQVAGVDLDPVMLERARAAWADVRGTLDPGRLRLHQGDLSTFRADGPFGLVFIAVNTFLLAPDDPARLTVLTTMRELLRDDGIAAVEFSTPVEEELAGYDGHEHHEWLRIDPETHDEVSKYISATHEPLTDIVRLTQRYEWRTQHDGPSGEVTNTDTLHLLSATHLGELAAKAGFSSVDLWGDHLAIPYGANSHRVILVARLV